MTVSRTGLPPLHLLLALAVTAVWGSNFVVIKFALTHLPPLTLALLRFALAFFPLALILPRPKVPWGNLAAYGVLIGAGQFGLLFTAMRADITPGLASLLVQSQVFFTIGLALWSGSERIAPSQVAGLSLATAGVATVAMHTDGSTTPLGLALVLAASACWAGGNMVARRAGQVNMIAYVAWSSLFALPPLLAFALALEGWAQMRAGMAAATWQTWVAVLWQTIGNTLFGYGMWVWLLARHEAGSVSLYALLVPLFGLVTAVLVAGEPLPPWKLVAFALIMSGVALGPLWPVLTRRFSK